jgi:hypothetical protein
VTDDDTSSVASEKSQHRSGDNSNADVNEDICKACNNDSIVDSSDVDAGGKTTRNEGPVEYLKTLLDVSMSLTVLLLFTPLQKICKQGSIILGTWNI